MSNALQVHAHGAAAAVANLSEDQLQLIKNTVARGCSNDELQLFLHICTKYDLDPFTKEAWCLKYGSNQPATIFTSRDGYMKIANLSPEMDGIQSDVVYTHDTLTKRSDGGVDHVYGSPDRGAVAGAYALVYRKDRSRPTYFYAPMSEYNNGRNPTWKNYPSAMIVKVAEAMALKRAFSISGLVTKEEMDSSQQYTTVEEQATFAEEVSLDYDAVQASIAALNSATTKEEVRAAYNKAFTADKGYKQAMKDAVERVNQPEPTETA